MITFFFMVPCPLHNVGGAIVDSVDALARTVPGLHNINFRKTVVRTFENRFVKLLV